MQVSASRDGAGIRAACKWCAAARSTAGSGQKPTRTNCGETMRLPSGECGATESGAFAGVERSAAEQHAIPASAQQL